MKNVGEFDLCDICAAYPLGRPEEGMRSSLDGAKHPCALLPTFQQWVAILTPVETREPGRMKNDDLDKPSISLIYLRAMLSLSFETKK